MAHLQLFFYIFLLATGLGGITVGAILVHRIRDRVLLVIVGVIVAFSTGLALFVVLFYLREVLAHPIDLGPAAAVVNLALVVAMYTGIGVVVRWVAPERSPLLLAAAATPVTVAYLLFGVLAPAVAPLAVWGYAHSDLVTLIAVLSAAIYLGYAGFALRRGGTAHTHESVRFLVSSLGWMLVCYAVLSSAATGLIVRLQVDVDPTVPFNYLLFLGWNVVAIVTFVRYLAEPADPLESGEIPAEVRRRFGITDREAHVIVHLSRGLSNKEIADRLNVSFTTVRTHVYSIFRKTGAASRVELLRILSGR